MRKALSYILTVPACLLFYAAEKVRGEKIAWRYREVIEKTEFTCTACGHKGKLEALASMEDYATQAKLLYED